MTTKSQENNEIITEKSAEELIDRMEKNELSVDDRKTIAKILRSFIYLSNLVQQTGIKIRTIREYFFGQKKKKPKPKPKPEQDPADTTEDDDTKPIDLPLTEMPPEDTRKIEKKPGPKQPGNNGRLTAANYTGATHQDCNHTELKIGDLCPNCGDRNLQLKKNRKEKPVLIGQAPISANILHLEILKCNGCKANLLLLCQTINHTGNITYL